MRESTVTSIFNRLQTQKLWFSEVFRVDLDSVDTASVMALAWFAPGETNAALPWSGDESLYQHR